MSSQSLEIIQDQYSTSIIPVKIIQQRQQAIWELMAGAMEKGTDYGLTPGCGDKNSLFKSGSEKILAMFTLAVDPLVEDLTPPGGGPYDEFRVRVYVSLKDSHSGRLAGKGLGECSSWEEKYKWRKAVTDGEFAYLEKQDPCLVRVKFGKDWKTKQEYQIKQVRVPTADIANTIVKMGKKRAQIDATLTATAASAIFTQDLEDMPEEVAEEIGQQEQQAKSGNEGVRRPQRKQQPEQKQEAKPEPKEPEKPRDPDCITEPQSKMLNTISRQVKLTDVEVKAEITRLGLKTKDGQPVEHTRDIQKKDFQQLIDSIDPEMKYHMSSKEN